MPSKRDDFGRHGDRFQEGDGGAGGERSDKITGMDDKAAFVTVKDLNGDIHGIEIVMGIRHNTNHLFLNSRN